MVYLLPSLRQLHGDMAFCVPPTRRQEPHPPSAGSLALLDSGSGLHCSLGFLETEVVCSGLLLDQMLPYGHALWCFVDGPADQPSSRHILLGLLVTGLCGHHL